MKSFISIIILFILSSFFAHAQFYTVGDDPGSLKWYRIQNRNYSVIYPEGLDSLAYIYGNNLEKYRIPLSYSSGFAPGQMTRTRMPVILHPYNAQSNGVVVWAPKRMELFTSPEPYAPEPMPWEQMLAIHESRHVAQMQIGLSHVFRPFNWIFGEMWPGAIAGLYLSGWLLEGDAVVAETALSESGRGRTADFLNWYMIAFDNGDFRRYRQWKYGSYRRYTPNEYALGYLFIGGVRYLYDCPDYTARYLHYAARRPYDLWFQNTIAKSISGKKMNDLFDEVVDFYHDMWTEEKALRAPFIPSEYAVDRKFRLYTQYAGSVSAPEGIYSLKNSLASSKALVLTDSTGKEKRLSAFASSVSKLDYSPSSGRLYWSESVPSARWSQKVNSKIRYYDIEKGRKRSITSEGKYFNPCVSDSLGLIAAAEYLAAGGSRIAVMDLEGDFISHIDAPDSLQIVELAWSADGLFASGVSEGGYGLYFSHMNGKEPEPLTCILEPEHVRITDLRSSQGKLLFTCDRTGVNELHAFDPGTGDLYRLTSTPYGATDFQFSHDGGTLYYSAMTHDGAILSKTPADSLICSKEDFRNVHVYKVAEKLSEQERTLAGKAAENPGRAYASDTSSFTEPERYRKFPHLFYVHSWAPAYFDYDNVSSFSFDRYYETVSLGAVALMQNHLGTFTANVGYSAHKDPYDKSFWRHSAHAKFTYTGLYPVFEASIDINDRAARNSFLSIQMLNENSYLMSLRSQGTEVPYISGRISTYIPFNFSSGGWYRGVIPRVTWSASNDVYVGKILQSMTASVRAYTMLASAASEIYPDLGIGMEAGYSGYLGLSEYFSPVAYGYIYGYLPGFMPSHGFRLTATGQWQTDRSSIFSSSAVNTLPRGLSSNTAASSYMSRFSSSLKLTAEYAIPVNLGDFNISSAFYVKRAIITPHFDFSLFPGGNLYSAGISAAIEFGCFFWIGTPINIGVTYSYNGGRSFSQMQAAGLGLGRHYVGPVMNISLPQ